METVGASQRHAAAVARTLGASWRDLERVVLGILAARGNHAAVVVTLGVSSHFIVVMIRILLNIIRPWSNE